MAFDLTQTAKLVDAHWRDSIQETAEFSAAFWNRIEGNPNEPVNTIGQKWKVRTIYNESEAGYDFDGQGLATGGNSQFQNLYVPTRTISATGLINQRSIDEDDGKSKYHPVVEEMNSTKLVAMKNLNRALMLDDGTGRRAVISTTETGSTVTAAPNTTFGNKGVQFIKPGKKVQIFDATGVTQRTGGGADLLTVSTSTAPVLSTGVITFTSAAPTDVVDTDIIVPEGMAGRGVNGLEYWVANSGSLFELSRSTYPGLKSPMVDGSSGSLYVLVESMFSKMAHYIEEDSALKGNHEIFWSPTQRERYRKECMGLGMAMVGSSKIDAGYGHKEEINGYTCTVIKDHSNTKIHFLIPSSWYRVGNQAAVPFTPYNPAEGGSGSGLYTLRSTTTGGLTTALAFSLRGYVNLACKNVRSQGAIYSLPTTGYETGNA